MELHPIQWIVALLAAACVGFSKTGFSGVSLVAVFLFKELFGAKASVGIVLPLLIFADLCVFPAFRGHGSWRPVWALLLPTFIGLGMGVFFLDHVNDELAAKGIGSTILLMASLQIIRMLRPEWTERIAYSRGFGVFAGILGGIATMMANAAGPLIKLFLLSRDFEKMELIGVSVRFFLLINLIKLPLSGSIGLIYAETLKFDLCLAPAVFFGIWLGRRLIGRVSERLFSWMILGFAVLAGLRLMF